MRFKLSVLVKIGILLTICNAYAGDSLWVLRNKIDTEPAPGLILALFEENPSWVLLTDKWALQGSGITEPDTLGNWPVSNVSVIADTSKCQIVPLEFNLPDYPIRYLKALIGGDIIDPVLAITDSMRVADSLFMLDQ